MFGRLLPIFILVFLILCFILVIWVHRTPTKKEGFAGITTGTGPHPQSILESGSTPAGLYSDYPATSVSGSYWKHYPSQFDYPNSKYGEWSKSPFNPYYDLYEENENTAIGIASIKFKDIKTVPNPIPDFGDTLGTFDSGTPTIPWDVDNKGQNPSDIVWGKVSQEASKSIFLKAWLQTVAANSANMQPCGEGSAHFCYSSPLLGISTSDPLVAKGYQAAEATVENLGGALSSEMELQSVGNESKLDAFRRTLNENRQSLRAPVTSAKIVLQQVKIKILEVGHALLCIGESKVLNLAKETLARLREKLTASVAQTTTKFAANAGAILGSIDGAAAGATAAAGVQLGVNPIADTLAVALTTLATMMHIIFGFAAMMMMTVNTLVSPIIQSVFRPGGVCPPNTKRLSELIPSAAWIFIGDFIPLGMFIQNFDPYVCWGPEPPFAKLMIPPKMPAFMSDRSLSLTYHADWVSGSSPNIPIANRPILQADPVPPGYSYLSQSNLAKSSNMNAIIQMATQQASATITAGAEAASAAAIAGYVPQMLAGQDLKGGAAAAGAKAAAEYRAKQMVAGSSGANLLVSDCPAGTVASDDGMTCVGSSYKTTVKQPVLSACPAGTYDDGFNCWTTQTASGGCTGGDLVITAGTTWDDDKGYLNSSVTPLVCNGEPQATNNNIAKWVNQRITCPTDANGTTYATAGLVCYANCKAGYNRVGAMCKSTNSVKRNYQYATSSMYYNQEMNTYILTDLDQVKVPYCNFADPIMLDRMAQFYYDNSMLNPRLNDDGTITVQLIVGFNGVTASSELSCDVVCFIKFITYDPITGGNYSVVYGCADSYTDDETFKSCPFCYRRFYFIRGPNDPQGIFTVTGCTFTDYTALDAMNLSADPASNLVQSVPKKFLIAKKEGSIIDTENLIKDLKSGQIAKNAGAGLVDVGVMMAGNAIGARYGGAVGGVVGGLAGGFITSLWLDKAIEDAAHVSIDTEAVSGAVNTFVAGYGKNLSVVSNNSWWTVDKGPIYELAAGFTPNINFCANSIIATGYCTYKYVVRDMVDKYHNENPAFHIKQVTAIEPRGADGCYYKFVKVAFDPSTNTEGVIENEDDLIVTHEIADYATCTYKPVSLITNSTNSNTVASSVAYPIRSYIDPATATAAQPKVIYPTRDTVYKSDLLARFVRIRPGATSMAISQIAVFDISGNNISMDKEAYATSTMSDAAPISTIVSGSMSTGTISVLSGSGSEPGTYWAPAKTADTEYCEVDLGKNVNISEVVYIGGTAKNKGIRIQFLYNNGATDTPIYEFSLPADDNVQYLPLYSSMYTVPSHPMSGPIEIPRPITRGILLSPGQGCINKCEDRDVIENMIQQYNTNTQGSEIIKVLAGITAKPTLCEYQAEVLVTDVAAGSSTKGKTSVVKQYMSMNIGLKKATPIGKVFGRHLRVIPSFTPSTVLRISNIIVWNAIPDGTGGKMKAGYVISAGKSINQYNEYYEIDQMGAGAQKLTTGSKPQGGPLIFQARDNDPATFFEIDLGDTSEGSGPTADCRAGNQEIFMIEFVGQTNSATNSIKGIELQIFADRPGDEIHCCDGTYPPVWRYIIPTDDVYQQIIVSPPAQCDFTLGTTTPSLKPVYLLPNVPAFSATDTSGGVFAYSGIINTLKTAWNSLSGSGKPIQSEDLVIPVQENIKQSDAIVNQMLETVAANQTIAGTFKKCNDTDVMGAMMLAYNISRGPADTDDTVVEKYIMNRILKSGQSTPTTCDVLFEELYELYDDYMVDITNPENKGSEVKAVRFKMSAVAGNAVPAQDIPGKAPKNIIDLSSNALGILTNVSLVTPPFSGPSYTVNCMDPTLLAKYRPILESVTRKSAGYKVRSSFRTVKGTFQPTPLTCEYLMTKDDSYSSTAQNYSYKETGVNTVAKATFAVGPDGKSVTFKTITEYYPDDITESADQLHTYMNGKEVILPNLSYYNFSNNVSKRVNTTVMSF